MPELTPDDLPAATRALFASNEEAQATIDAVLAAARRYCGWVVSPTVDNDEVVVDGPGRRVLSLPTLHLVGISAIDEDGVSVDPADVRWSRLGMVRKRGGAYWSGEFGAIAVTMTHGFPEKDAADWRQAIVRMVGIRAKETTSHRDDPRMSSKRVDDVEYSWFATLVSNDELLGSVFSQFRILPQP